MARNPVAANILLILIIAAGIYSAFEITQEVFPDFELNRIRISASYPGAGPTEVSTSVCRPIEEAVAEVAGLDSVICSAQEDPLRHPTGRSGQLGIRQTESLQTTA